MNFITKLKFLLPAQHKRRLLALLILMFIGMLFEMAGLGILIPVLSLLMNTNIAQNYPSVKPFLHAIGDPTQAQLAFGAIVVLLVFYIIKSVYLGYLGWKQSKFVAELSADLAQNLFLGYLHQPYTFHLQRNSASLLANLQIEITQFTLVAQSTMFLTLELSAVIGSATVLMVVEPVGAIGVTSFLAFAAFLFHKITKRKVLGWGEKRQLHSEQINQHLLQGLGGVKDLKLMGREKYFSEEFNFHNSRLAKITTRITALSVMPRIYLELLAVMGLSGMIGLMMLQNKPMTLFFPVIGVFAAAAFRMMPSVNRIMAYVQNIRYAEPVINILYDEFSLIHASSREAYTKEKLSFKQLIKIENVFFSYPNTVSKAINGISLEIFKGESVGFIGTSGSGKSTLMDIILGLLTPDEGFIKIDGKDIKQNMRAWQNQIGYVPQTIYLTDSSLRNNIAFGIPPDQIDEEAVDRALKASQLEDFVKSLPEGLQTFVGDRGIRLSGGQRQRIGIARALYYDPEVLVLDEATSALDSVTETEIMIEMNALQGTKTLIIVAHRLSTVANCNRLFRLEDGRMIKEGSPVQLLNK